MSKKDWRLLEAYKATGLSPEQIIKMKEEYLASTDNRPQPKLQTEKDNIR